MKHTWIYFSYIKFTSPMLDVARKVDGISGISKLHLYQIGIFPTGYDSNMYKSQTGPEILR